MIKKFLTIIALLMFMSSFITAQEEGSTTTAPTETPTEQPAPEPASEPTTEQPQEPEQQPVEQPPTEEPLQPQEPIPPQTEPLPQEPSSQQPPQEPMPSGEGQTREGCWVGEERVPCPNEVGEGCQPIFNPGTGMTEVRCGEAIENPKCPPFPADAARRCAETGGNPQEFKDQRGCQRFECRFGSEEKRGFGQRCPPFEEIESTKRKCEEQNMQFTVSEEFGCKIARCEGGMGQRPGDECHKLPPSEEIRIKEDCKEKGGYIIQEFDERGCVFPRCSEKIREQKEERGRPDISACRSDVPKDAYTRCEEEGGQLTIKNDERGCIVFSKCVRRGDSSELEYEFVESVPPATKLVEIAFKLEEIKISFGKLAKKSEAIAQYYRSVGDEANAKKFETITGMFTSAQGRVEDIKIKMREKIKDLTPEDIMNFKHDLKYISEVIMEDVAYVMLGGTAEFEQKGEIRGEESFEESGVSKGDCGFDFRCFEKSLRICSPTKFAPEPNIEIKISGLENKNCKIEIEDKRRDGTSTMECLYPDYAFGDLNKEAMLPYCKGALVESYKKEEIATKTEMIEPQKREPMTKEMRPRDVEGFNSQTEIMGCKKVENGMVEKGVCGNACCEPSIGENERNCPRDCTGNIEFNPTGRFFAYAEKAANNFKLLGAE
ncbi:hypothetical protein HY643_04710 [Candidatus Woesearchaeota archaeon]|nr:hypothetical protein [Candidatus Woesearchaeota archaeon]